MSEEINQAPAAEPAEKVQSSAEHALEIRGKAIQALSELRASVPDHAGDVALGGVNGDLDCAIAIMKPRS